MLNFNFKPQRLSRPNDNTQLLKVLVFEMANHFFALPISVIFKVINCPSVTNSADSSLGIADFEGQTVTVVNLAQKLLPQNSTTESLPKRFLILSQTRQGELCGIPISKPPALLELPVDNIRPLPLSARQIDSLSIATHVATLPKAEGDLKVFLLGMAT
ncbi:MAG: chemotaxis protein CheW [Xenococcaceae cyanobacterium MO_188.B29]|nr:chemotaxis protein CheW [Xenococcaceae cyanobacterium MO_188.B29]